jgi:flagellar motor switch protein FliN/FliY
MTPAADAASGDDAADRLLAATDAIAAELAIGGLVAGPAAPQSGLEDLMVAEAPTGGWAEAADGTLVVVLLGPDGAARWPDPSQLVLAVTAAADALGAAIGELQLITDVGELPSDLQPSRGRSLVGAGIFDGDVPVASVGVTGSSTSASAQGAASDAGSRQDGDIDPGSQASPTGGATGADTGSEASGGTAPRNLHLLADVVLGVTAELGRTTMTMGELLDLRPGGVIELDREAGAPVDIAVNHTLIARGEVVMVDGRYAVRITEVVADGGLR